jgi:hypothetical protein
MFHRKTATLALTGLLLLSCCIIAFGIHEAGVRASGKMRDYVLRELKPGMSRSEVYKTLNRAGTYRFLPMATMICHADDTIKSERFEVYIYGDWWYTYSVGLFTCFNESGMLIYFQEIID